MRERLAAGWFISRLVLFPLLAWNSEVIVEMKTNLILHNIRSNHNVGSIFRTADAVGVEKIYFCGYTPAPIDRFGRSVKEIKKTALGAEKNIPWEQVSDIQLIIEKLKKENFEVVALEQAKNSIDYKTYKPKKDFALIVGNEVGGVPDDVLKLCDKIIEIPMRGKLTRNRHHGDGHKESLNVSVATGVALFRLLGL